MKKLMSMVLAGAMALSLCLPAAAIEQSTTATATPKIPTIKVTVPSNPKIVLNPYRINVGGDTANHDQVVANTVYCENQSDVDMRVVMKVAGTVAGKAKLATAVPGSSTKTNDVYMTLSAKITDKDDGTRDPSKLYTMPEETTDGTLLIATGTAKEVPGFKAADPNTDANTMQAKGENKKVFLAVKFSGQCNDHPTTDWVAADTVSAALAFTFIPQPVKLSAGTLGSASDGTLNDTAGTFSHNATGATVTLTLSAAATADGVALTNASDWTLTSSDEEVATAEIADSTGVITLAKAAAGTAVITISAVGNSGMTYARTLTVTFS